MKLTLLAALMTAAAVTINAGVISIDLGPPRIVHGDIFVTTGALSGTPLDGQTLSLDYQFSHLIHLFSTTSAHSSPGAGFYFAIRAETNMAPSPQLTLIPSAAWSGYAVGLNGYQGQVQN